MKATKFFTLMFAASYAAIPAQAEPIQFTFGGTVTDIFDVSDPPWNTVQVGDPWEITYTFESTTPDSSPGIPLIGEYLAITWYTLTIGNAPPVSDSGPPGLGSILVFNHWPDEPPPGYDQYEVYISSSQGGFNWFMQLDDSTGTAWNNPLLNPRESLRLCGDIPLPLATYFASARDFFLEVQEPHFGQILGSVDYHNCSVIPCIDPPPDMVAWYTGDDCTPTDFLGNHDGSFEGSPECPVNWKVGGGALAFFPETYVEVPDAPPLNIGKGDFSVDAWMKTGAFGFRPIVEKGSGLRPGYGFRLQSGRLQFVVCDGNSCGSVMSPVFAELNNGIWHHVAATYSRGAEDQIDIYIDGAPVVSLLFGPLGFISNMDDLLIGAGPSGTPPAPTTFFIGELDEIEIFNRALDPSEIEAIFLADSAGKCKCLPPPSDMVAWWPFDETSGPTAHNIAGPDDGAHRCAVEFVPGKVGGAYRLTLAGPSANPNQSYVTVNNPTSNLEPGSGSFTIDAWIYPEPCSLLHPSNQSFCNPRPIVTKHSVLTGYAFFVDDGSLGVKLNGTPFLSGLTPVVDNQWQHVAVTIDRTANQGTFYYNGVGIEVFGVPSSNVNTGTVALRIGQSPSLLISNCNTAHCSANPSYYFDGRLDEIEIFKRALDEDEILAIYRRGSHGKCKPDDGAPPETVVAFGLPHTVLGQANLATDESGNLVVANIGSSGEDGVVVDAGEAQFLTIGFADLGSLPDGATLNLAGDGTVGGLMGQPVSTLAVSRAGDNWIITPDFSAIGSPLFQYQVWMVGEPVGVIPGDGALIASVGPDRTGGGRRDDERIGDCGCGPDRPVRYRCNDPGGPNDGVVWASSYPYCRPPDNFPFGLYCSGEWEFHGCTPAWQWWLRAATVATFEGDDGTGEVLIGDTVEIMILEDLNVSFPLTQLSITADGLSSFSIGGEQLGVFGLPHQAKGQALLAGLEGGTRLSIANIGSSGEDGVTIDLGQTNGWAAEWLAIEPECTSEGASLELVSTGSVDGGAEQTLGTGSWIATEGTAAFSADFNWLGATTYSVEAYINGELIDVMPGNPNGSVTVWNLANIDPRFPRDIHAFVWPFFSCSITWDSTLLAGGAGRGPFIDEIRLVPEDATGTVDYISSVTLFASDISEITMTDEDVALCGGCPTDSDGSGDTRAFDLAILLGAWGLVTPNSACLDADENGFIGAFDLAVLLGAWGPCP